MPNAPIYAIGDVHGAIAHLDRLLGRITVDAQEAGIERPRLVMLGDYGDRGADSRAVYDRLSSREFEAAFDAVLVKGNHEDMLITAEAEPSTLMLWLNNGGADFVESYGFEFHKDAWTIASAFFAALPTAHKRLLSRMRPWHEEGGYLFVHAGIDPLRPRGRDPDDLMWVREPFLSCVDDYGFTVVHGHTPSANVVVRRNRIGVDTGCGHHPSHPLSAVVLPGGGGAPLRVLNSHP